MKKQIILFLIITLTCINHGFSQTISIAIVGGTVGTYSPGGHVIYISPSIDGINFYYNGPYPQGFRKWYVNYGPEELPQSNDNLSFRKQVSPCESVTISFNSSLVAFSFLIVRLQSPTISGPSILCQGQSSNFNTGFLDGMNFNWSGTGGISVQSNQTQAFVSVNTSSGKIFCTASNQCGSNTVSRKMGIPSEETIDVYHIPNSINDGETISLSTDDNSTNWATYHGYFNGNQGSQNVTGYSVYYTAINSAVNAIFVTQSNSCGTGTKTIAINTNNPSYWNNSAMTVFPNPASTTLNLQLPQTDSFENKSVKTIIEKIDLFDKNGVLMRSLEDAELREISSSHKVAIDVKNLLADEYYLHITNKQGKVEKIRILIGDRR